MENFDEFYKDNIPQLRQYASTFVSNTAAANDIALEMLNKCWERRDMFESKEHALAYTRVMIKNKALNYIRHIQSRLQMTDNIDESSSVDRDYSSGIISNEIYNIVDNTLAGMPEKTREIFIKSKLQKQAHKDIAAEMGLCVKAVEYHITKATKALRLALSDYLNLK